MRKLLASLLSLLYTRMFLQINKFLKRKTKRRDLLRYWHENKVIVTVLLCYMIKL